MQKKLSEVERLILANQFKILAILDEEIADEIKEFVDIIEGGYTNEYGCFFRMREEIPYDVCFETREIFLMYDKIKNLNFKEDIAKLDKIGFEGFDTSDPHYRYAEHLVKYHRSLKEWKNVELKSIGDFSPIEKYKKMLSFFQGEKPLNLETLTELNKILSNK